MKKVGVKRLPLESASLLISDLKIMNNPPNTPEWTIGSLKSIDV